MSQELTPMQSFQERVRDKLRDDIGSLLPDEAIGEMVQRVIDEEFFTKKKVRKNPHSYHDNEMIELLSPFQEAVIEAAKPMIKEHVGKALEANVERIQAALDEAVSRGIVGFAIKHMDKVIAEAFKRQPWELDTAIMQVLQREGLASG